MTTNEDNLERRSYISQFKIHRLFAIKPTSVCLSVCDLSVERWQVLESGAVKQTVGYRIEYKRQQDY